MPTSLKLGTRILPMKEVPRVHYQREDPSWLVLLLRYPLFRRQIPGVLPYMRLKERLNPD
jgi:hypothetical protein